MKPTDPSELPTLIARLSDGSLTPAEAERLNALLKADPIAREAYLDHLAMDALLENEFSVSCRLPLPELPRKKRPALLAWLGNARAGGLAAGLLIGFASATASFAGVGLFSDAPGKADVSQLQLRELPLADPDFEGRTQLHLGGVPSEFGRWQGDLCENVAATGNVNPMLGASMLRFLSVSRVPNEVDTQPICSDLWQTVALPGGGPRSVTVRAWFNSDTAPKTARFHLMALAGSGDLSEAPAMWESRFGNGVDTLASSRSVLHADSDPTTWEMVEVTLEVPANARTLIVALAAYRLPQSLPAGWLPAQFADNISVSVRAKEVQP